MYCGNWIHEKSQTVTNTGPLCYTFCEEILILTLLSAGTELTGEKIATLPSCIFQHSQQECIEMPGEHVNFYSPSS
jgi:hypothetical protein